MFRTLGLRHLLIIDTDCKVSGIVTRKDITEGRIKAMLTERSRHPRSLDLFVGLEQLSPLTVSSSDRKAAAYGKDTTGLDAGDFESYLQQVRSAGLEASPPDGEGDGDGDDSMLGD
eukprot:gene16790-21228_t